MARLTIDVRTSIDAPPDRVWSLLSDVTGWSVWGPFDAAELERPGRDVPEGPGAIRRFRRGRRRTRELVTAAREPHHFAYTLLSGIPVRDYHAEVDLEPDGTGTRLSWRSQFRPAIPGTGRAIRKNLGGFIKQLSRALGTEAERRTRASATGW